MIVVPPIRKRIGDGPREKVPLTYPSEFAISNSVTFYGGHEEHRGMSNGENKGKNKGRGEGM